jgi:hypothetical protein
MTMNEMMDRTLSEMGLRSIRAYRSKHGVDPWIVDVVTETSITGTGMGETFELALASAVEATRQSAGRIHYVVQRDGGV